MRLRVGIDGHDVSNACLVESLTINQDSTQGISTAQLSLYQAYGIARYDMAMYDRAAFVYEWTVREWSEIVIWDQDTNKLLFGGYALSIDEKLEGPHLIRQISASDWGILLERSVITHTWPDGTPDSTIVRDVLATVPELSAGTIVTQVANLGKLEVKDQSARDVLEAVCELTGGEWHVGYDGKLNYYRIGSILPPFALTDLSPNGVTTVGFQLDGFTREFSEAANRIQVLGAISDSGELAYVANEATSQQQYGVLSVTVVDRNITDMATAQLFASTELAQRAWPVPTINVSLYTPGLARGQTVAIEAARYGVAGSFVLRTLTVVIAAPDRARIGDAGHRCKYSASLGMRKPDLIYTLRRMQRRAPERTISPPTVVAPGSITADDLAVGLGVIYRVSRKPQGAEWLSYPADAVWFNTTDRKLYRRLPGNDWTALVPTSDIEGQLQTTQLAPGSVTSTILADGSVITAKIPDGAIQGPKLAAESVTANVIAANAIYSEALQANIIKSQHLTANSVVAGKIAALAVLAGNLAADSVTAGTIAAAAVRAGNLAADSVVAGTIAAGAIRAEDAAFATAAIKNADIAELNGNKITAQTIDSTKLNAFEIAVGYGALKPGRFAVYSPSGIIALIGDLTGAGAGGSYGIWAKLGSFGGNGYSDAPLYTDLNGNLFLRNAKFTLTSGSQVVTIDKNTFDPSYSSIGVKVADGTNYSWHVGRGYVTYNNAGQVVAAAVTHPTDTNAGQIYCQKPGGVNAYCMMDGQTGFIRADAGFMIGATQTVIDSGRNIIGVTFRIGATTVIDNGRMFVGAGVNTAGSVRADAGYQVAGGTTVVNNLGTFVGAGVNTPSNGIAGAGFNPFVGGVQWNGVQSAQFTTADGKTVMVRGGAIVSVA